MRKFKRPKEKLESTEQASALGILYSNKLGKNYSKLAPILGILKEHDII